MKTAAAAPPNVGVKAARTDPEAFSTAIRPSRARIDSGSGRAPSYRGRSSTTREPAPLNSGETMRLASDAVTAKEIRVGGTSSPSKDPLIESLPPIAAMPRSSWAAKAPSSAAVGWPQRRGSSPGRPKYSWKLSAHAVRSAPAAARRQTDSTTARYAPS